MAQNLKGMFSISCHEFPISMPQKDIEVDLRGGLKEVSVNIGEFKTLAQIIPDSYAGWLISHFTGEKKISNKDTSMVLQSSYAICIKVGRFGISI